MFTSRWSIGPADECRDEVICYQYRAGRARSTLRGMDEQVAMAEKAVAGKSPVKRNRFIQLSGGTRSVNRGAEGQSRGLGEKVLPDPSWAKLVRTRWAVDVVDGLAEVSGRGRRR
jgi:hypothetical protein